MSSFLIRTRGRLGAVERLRVSVEQDHLEKLIKTPAVGLAELVWNGYDADATVVDITLTENPMGGVESVTITDNGSGITLLKAQQCFGHLGGSWKKTAGSTDGGRVLHGRNGQGRWSAYAIGSSVRWKTIAVQVTGERQQLEIVGHRGSLDEFSVGDLVPVAADAETGTVVTVTNLTEAAEKALPSNAIIDDLTATFALYIQQYRVRLNWQGVELSPERMQSRRHQAELAVEGIDGVGLTIIEWNRTVQRALHLCEPSGTSLFQLPPGVQAPGFEFTAYVTWDGFTELSGELALAELGYEPLAAIVDAAKAELRRYFKERAREKGSQLLRAWKEEQTYPYKSEPVSTVDRAERNLFDIVAVVAAPAVETSDVRSRKLSLRLLREAIETSPGAVHDILREVLDLPPERLDELKELMEQTSLSSIITAARQITNRLDFLAGLEQIVFDRELRKHVLERSQLHRILAAETWVFREEYALTADDVTLKTALRDHIKLLGRDHLTREDAESAEVLDEHGRRVVVDMMLSRVIEQRRNHREHIVIELKRPNVHVGVTEFGQIQNYATAVAADARFARTDCRWEFWIIGDILEDGLTRMANQKGREPGIVVEEDGFIVRALTWGQVIQDARHRLSFIKNALDYQTSEEAGLRYLRQTHGRYLPILRSAGSVDSAAGSSET